MEKLFFLAVALFFIVKWLFKSEPKEVVNKTEKIDDFRLNQKQIDKIESLKHEIDEDIMLAIQSSERAFVSYYRTTETWYPQHYRALVILQHLLDNGHDLSEFSISNEDFTALIEQVDCHFMGCCLVKGDHNAPYRNIHIPDSLRNQMCGVN